MEAQTGHKMSLSKFSSPLLSKSEIVFGTIRRMNRRKLESILLACLTETALLVEAHKDRHAQAEAEIADLLGTRQTQAALLCVEQVIGEKNMFEVVFMVQRILHILMEKGLAIHTYKWCPYELKEEVASLIFAAPRCSNCTNLQNFPKLLKCWFMKNSSQVSNEASQQMIHLMSTRQPSLESRLTAINEIASAHGIRLKLMKTSLSEFDELSIPEFINHNKTAQTPIVALPFEGVILICLI